VVTDGAESSALATKGNKNKALKVIKQITKLFLTFRYKGVDLVNSGFQSGNASL
jgi:hypothetical protein